MAGRRTRPPERLARFGLAERQAALRRHAGAQRPVRGVALDPKTSPFLGGQLQRRPLAGLPRRQQAALRVQLGPAPAPAAGQPATGAPSPARAVPVREADPGARPAAAAAAPAGAPDRPEAVLAAAPTTAPASSASAHSHLNLTSRFVPAPELPYDELIRQAKARKAQEAQ